MNFKSLTAFVALLLPVAVIASPVTDVSGSLMHIHARAFTLHVVPAPVGDYIKLLAPKPTKEPAPDKGCVMYRKVLADWKKNEKSCTTYDNMKEEFDNAITPSVTRVLQAAEAAMHLTGLNIVAQVKASFHDNPANDPLPHWTFTFEAPACGVNPGDICTGHAYNPTGAPIGKIWAANHAVVFERV